MSLYAGEDLIRGFEVNDTRPGRSEIEIEDSGPIFPLTRRGGQLEKQEAAVFPVEVDEHSPKLERDQFSKGSEAAEDEYEIEHNPDHFLSRIQEEDADELGEDGSPCQNSVSSAQVPDRGADSCQCFDKITLIFFFFCAVVHVEGNLSL